MELVMSEQGTVRSICTNASTNSPGFSIKAYFFHCVITSGYILQQLSYLCYVSYLLYDLQQWN